MPSDACLQEYDVALSVGSVSVKPGFGGRFAMRERDFERLAAFIEGSVGIKMPPQKKSMLELRLARRLRALSMDSFDEYCDYVFDSEQGVAEIVTLVDHVTTNKTDFFRESEHFDRLVGQVLDDVRRTDPRAGVQRPLRVWSAGCSSGEEPYSIAMSLQAYSECEERLDFQVVATDLSTAMLSNAVRAVYATQRAEGIPTHLRRRYVLKSKDPHRAQVRIARPVRERVTFHWLNLLEPYSFVEPFDIVFCRNTLIYFEREVQIDVLSRIAETISNGGYLFVGHSETLHGMGLPLAHVAPTVYRRIN